MAWGYFCRIVSSCLISWRTFNNQWTRIYDWCIKYNLFLPYLLTMLQKKQIYTCPSSPCAHLVALPADNAAEKANIHMPQHPMCTPCCLTCWQCCRESKYTRAPAPHVHTLLPYLLTRLQRKQIYICPSTPCAHLVALPADKAAEKANIHMPQHPMYTPCCWHCCRESKYTHAPAAHVHTLLPYLLTRLQRKQIYTCPSTPCAHLVALPADKAAEKANIHMPQQPMCTPCCLTCWQGCRESKYTHAPAALVHTLLPYLLTMLQRKQIFTCPSSPCVHLVALPADKAAEKANIHMPQQPLCTPCCLTCWKGCRESKYTHAPAAHVHTLLV